LNRSSESLPDEFSTVIQEVHGPLALL